MIDKHYYYARYTIRETARRLNMDSRTIDLWCATFTEEKGSVFVSSIEAGTCDCQYCRDIREAKAKEEALKKHKAELDKAVDLLLSFDCNTEPTAFKGFDFKLEPVDPDLESEAVSRWLRECEKEIAKAFGISEAWVHISINGDFLCSL